MNSRLVLAVVCAFAAAACSRSADNSSSSTPLAAPAARPEPQKVRAALDRADPGLRAAIRSTLQSEAGAAYALGEGLRARNPDQGFEVGFDARGARIAAGSWGARLALAGFGCPGDLRPVASASVAATGNRLALRRPAAGFEEWYLNGPLGLEFGYTLAEAPACARKGAPVVFEVGVEGPALAAEAGAVALLSGGRAVARVGEAYAKDAVGKSLPIALDVVEGRLRVRVDVSGAQFPVEVDPTISTEVKRVSPTGTANSDFGRSAAIDGDYAVFGAPLAQHSVAVPAQCCSSLATCDTGAAFVYFRGVSGWALQARLERPVGEAFQYERYGHAVAISGDRIVVGAHNADANVPGAPTGCFVGSGVAFVYTRSGTTWSQTAKLAASDGYRGDQFGWSVAIEGTTVLVGANEEDVGTPNPPNGGVVDNRGSAYLFTFDGASWNETAIWRGVASDNFGTSVDLSGDSAIVGAPSSVNFHGSASVYLRSSGTWAFQQKLSAADGQNQDAFGSAVAISSNSAVVGAPRHDPAGTDSGAAYVFTRSGATWSQQQELTASDEVAGDTFGASVALEGEKAVVGAPLGRAGPVLSLLDAWQNVHSSSPGNSVGSVTTSTVTPSAGKVRLLMAAVALETDVPGVVGVPIASFGGANMSLVASTRSRTTREHVHMFYLRDAGIPAGAQSFIVSYGAGTHVVTGFHVSWATYGGVDQTSPLVDSAEYSNLNTSSTPSTIFGTGVSVVVGGLTVLTAVNAGSAAALTDPTGFTTALTTAANGHTSVQAQTARHTTTTGHASNTPVVFTGTTDIPTAVVVASLRPALKHGAAYVWTRSGATWTEQDKLVAATPVEGAWLGTAVAFSPGYVVAGAPGDDEAGLNASGAGYFFAQAGAACGGPGDSCPAGTSCVDGVCCTTLCDGVCQSCNQPGFAGQCRPIASADDPGRCDGDKTCSAAGACLWDRGLACDVNGDCASSACSPDKVCCDRACAGTCESCALNASKGTCTPYANGTDPDAECGTGACKGTCTGASACGNYPGSSTSCGSATCSGSTLTPGGACSGAGSCTAGASQPCPGSLVCASASACLAECTQQADCVSGTWCDTVARQCKPKADPGVGCGQPYECKSGKCVDGVCCTGDCTGLCERCDVATHLGTCWAVPDAQDPDEECTGTGTCGGVCDGARVCRFPGSAVTCGPQSCSGSTLVLADACNGAGACTDSGTQACPGNLDCNLAGTGCLASCAQESDCLGGYWCDPADGSCKLKGTAGTACANGYECELGKCVHGVCCNADCNGACERCDLASHQGTCWAVADGQDPGDQCAGTGTCGGVCNGARGCRFPDSSTQCAAATCSGGSAIPARSCDGAGACAANAGTSCSPWACQGSACATACNGDGDCAAGFACDLGTHACKSAPGATCGVDGDCASGVCAGGKCCTGACPHGDADCGGTCDASGACSLPTTSKTCGTGACKVCDGNGACLGTPADSDGCPALDCAYLSTTCKTYTYSAVNRCKSFGVCKTYPADCVPSALASSGTSCGTPTCATGTETRKQCDGSGACGDVPVSCAPYVCGGSGTCLTTCTLDAHCAAGLACHVASGSCRGANGDACSGDAQCASGFCADGVCCNSACTGLCKRCDLTASKGTCADLATGQDPDDECTGTGTCGGSCSGSGACSFPTASTNCGLCLGCDGTGACGAKPADDPACGAIACSALSSTCRTYTDLTANRCSQAGTCVAPSQLTCTAYADAPSTTACNCTGGGSGNCSAGTCVCAGADAGTAGPDAAAAGPDAAATGDDASAAGADAAAAGADAALPGPDAQAPAAADAAAPSKDAATASGVDAASAAADAGPMPAADAGGGAGAETGCGCGTTGGASATVLLAFALLLVPRRRP